MSMLKLGEVLSLSKGGECVIKEKIGGGGQGEVYRSGTAAGDMAIKWYNSESACHQQRQVVENLIGRNNPNTRFVWPNDLVDKAGSSSFGYVMPLLENNFFEVADLLSRQREGSLRSIATMCFHISVAFYDLHVEGLSYRDISCANIAICPELEDVRIIDLDNVSLTGASFSSVCGTAGYMAPEIIRGEANPSVETDLFSLAVILFEMLHNQHPLNGIRERKVRVLDNAARKLLYGTDPIFIFDPHNGANRPHPRDHQNAYIFWGLYPKSMRRLFTRAFTEGLLPQKRIRESQWKTALLALRDSIYPCPSCGRENVYCAYAVRKKRERKCWNCEKHLPLPARMKLGDNIVVINDGADLYSYHFGGDMDLSRQVAEVQSVTDDYVVLRNTSLVPWTVATKGAHSGTVSPGSDLTLADGDALTMQGVEVQVRL